MSVKNALMEVIDGALKELGGGLILSYEWRITAGSKIADHLLENYDIKRKEPSHG